MRAMVWIQVSKRQEVLAAEYAAGQIVPGVLWRGVGEQRMCFQGRLWAPVPCALPGQMDS